MSQNYTNSAKKLKDFSTKSPGHSHPADAQKETRKPRLLTSLYAFLILLGLCYSPLLHAQVTDNIPGIGKTHPVPAGVTSVTASAWGGGGGGGGSSTNGFGGNGGGGGGATSSVIAVTGGTTLFTYTVGSGGSAGIATAGGPGGDGTQSSITAAVPSVTMTANPGTGGKGNAVTLNTPTNSDGGTASGGTTNNPGIDGNRGGASGGNGGNSGTVLTIFGTGGTGGTDANGFPGVTPGAGGGGGERGGGSIRAGGAGSAGRVTIHYIGVTGITPNPVCIGNTITITGFNFATTGSTTVSINGTLCTSVTVLSATSITAVVAAGTTSGTVITTNPNGTNNGQTITITPSLTAIGGGAATVCVGATTAAFTNATGGGTWSVTNGTGSATIDAGGVVTGVTAGTVTVTYTVSGCPVTQALTVNPLQAVAITPSPADAATDICAVGTGAVTSVSWAVSAGATSYDVYFGAGSLPGAVTANVATNSYTTGTLLSGTTYYWKVVAKNACGGAVGSSTWTFTTRAVGCYCAPTYATGPGTTNQITNVTLGTLNNTSGASASPFYTFFSAVTVPDLVQLSTASVSVTLGSNANQYVGVWIDYNNDGTFQASEGAISGNAGGGGTVVLTIPIPIGAVLGNTIMRVRGGENSALTTAQACGASSDDRGEAEDYIVNIIAPPAPTITSLGSASGCEGTSITINGTNLSGATAASVQIGGTAVSSITSNTGTVLVAVIGSGTTGNVSVTTSGGTGTSATPFTVTPLPVITVQPATPATVCSGVATRTISVTATGATTYQWRLAGVAIANNATYSGVTTATLTITNPGAGAAGSYDVVLNNATCPLTSNAVTLSLGSLPTAVITPSPANAATGVCFSGIGAITSVSWAASAGATSYDVYFGAGSLPGTVTSNVAVLTYTTGVLAANTTYYWKVVAKNSCGDAVGSSTWTFTTSRVACYCQPTFTTGIDAITNVTFGTINNTTAATSTAALESFGFVSNVIQGSATNAISVKGNTNGNYTEYVRVYIDWDQNGTLGNVANEIYNLGTITNSTGTDGITLTGNIAVPVGATLGHTKMRVIQRYGAYSTSPCQIGTGYGQAEDYIVNVVAAVACVTPTAQPTSLLLTPSGNYINGTFTLASPAADSYLVVINTTGVAPVLVNGTTYTVGSVVSGSTVVDVDGNNSFTASGLTPYTLYYIYVFANNSLCIGGPLYNSTSPLNGSTTTTAPVFCIPTGNLDCTANDYISNVTFNTLNNTTTCGTGGYTNYAPAGTLTTTAYRASNYNFSLTVGNGSGSHGGGVWIDFNQNADFSDAGEFFLIGNNIKKNTTTTINIPIPLTANIGPLRMRVRYAYSINLDATMSCITSGFDGETEDYTINIADATACVTPTAQPTALAMTPTENAISGTFTFASPLADDYLVIINTTNTTPVPVNGTTYAIGDTVGAGNTVVDIDSDNMFTAIGLSPLTTYYVFVFAYNNLCIGGPLYNGTTPLNGSSTTLAASLYCKPSVTAGYENYGYIINVSFVGTLNDTSNNSTYSSSPLGYQDFSAIANKAIQAQGEGVNISVQGTHTSFTKAWVDWNKDGDYNDAQELVYDTGGVSTYSTTFGFVIPIATPVGDYRVRIRLNNRDVVFPYDVAATNGFGPCGNIVYNGETEDYMFTVVPYCTALITSVTDGETCGSGTVDLAATGSVGVTQFHWYANAFGGTPLATNAGNWTTPSLTNNVTYYVAADDGCESLVRTAVLASVSPIPTLDFNPTNPVVCGEDVVITLNVSGDTEQVFLIDEDFETSLGLFSNTNYITNGATIDALSAWQIQTSTFVPAEQVWFPAISSGFGTNKFAMTTSDVGSYIINNALASSSVNSTNFLNLTLSFDVYYSRYYADGFRLADDYVTVDVSTDGGTVWNEVTRYTSDLAIGTAFENRSFNLNSYINVPNLQVRIQYYGDWCDGIAVDNVKLYGSKPLNTAFNWASATPVNAFTNAACTIPYTVLTPVATVYVKPTLAQLEEGVYDFTAQAILDNGCDVSQLISVTNTSKIWQNGTTAWNDPTNWKPLGVPTSANCVIIPNHTIISGTAYEGFAKNLTVKPTGILDVQSDNSITVTEWVHVDAGGTFNLENSASLVQIDDIANTGSLLMKRNATIRKLDYVYWSSPVANFASSAISTGTPSGSIYKWTPTIPANTNGWGNWAAGSESMLNGKGYIVRGPNSFNTTLQTFTATFGGVPNNGTITTPVSRGTYDGVDYVTPASTTLATNNDDNWNLIGNPYPSALNAIDFLTLNTNIAGFVKIWTHGTIPTSAITDPFYDNYLYNYTPSDYVTYNALGTSSGPAAFGGNIGAGQGFFVLMEHTSAAATETVTFNNSMRNRAYNNSQFFRNATATENETTIERNRIWLDLVAASGASVRTLVGYATEATNSKDRLYDAITDSKLNFNLYSVTDNQKMSIQGRALPFDQNDTVPMGIKVAQNGVYTIAIGDVDGLFTNANQLIFIEDLQTGTIQNLRIAPYSFTTTSGDIANRFVLRFTENSLGNETFELDNSVTVSASTNIQVKSSNEPIQSVQIFDLLGRSIANYTDVSTTDFSTKNLRKTQTTLLVKVILENGFTKTYKVIY